MSQQVKLSEIVLSKENPRAEISNNSAEFESLKASIKKQGVLQPVLLRPKDGKNELVFGYRRYAACKALGLETIPAEIRHNLSENTVAAIRLVENLQREDLNPVEQAQGFKRLMDVHNLTIAQVADKLSRKEEYVKKHLALLGLDKKHLQEIIKGNLSLGHGLLAVSLKNAKEQNQFVKKVIANKMSIRSAKEFLQYEFTLRISDAPFPASECAKCPCLSDNQSSLFEGGVSKGDKGRCTNSNRFWQKIADWKKKQEEASQAKGKPFYKDTSQALAKHTGAVVLNYDYNCDGKTIESVCAKKCDKAIFAWGKNEHDKHERMVICPDAACRKKTFKLRSSGNGSKSGETLSKEQKAKRRRVAAAYYRQTFVIGEAVKRLPARPDIVKKIALYHLLEDSAKYIDLAKMNKALGFTIPFEKHSTFVNYPKLLNAKLTNTQLDKATAAVLCHIVAGYDHTDTERAGFVLGVKPQKEFLITEDYLKTFTKEALVKLAKEIGLVVHLKAKKKLPKGDLTSQKKGVLVDLFRKTGYPLTGKVPQEIAELYKGKRERQEIEGK